MRWLLAWVVASAAASAAAQSLQFPSGLRLDEIGSLPYWPDWSEGRLVFADTDHDGRNEIILYARGMIILEHQGGDTYAPVYTMSNFHPMAAGDFDGDGCSEILGNLRGHLALLEAPDAFSHPTELRWYFKPSDSPSEDPEVAVLSNPGSPLQDSDRDGRLEIVTRWGSRLRIFEHFSGDQWIEVFVGDEIGGASESATCDLDGDGLLEIALGVGGRIVLYESPADNAWTRTYTSHDTFMWNAFALEGGSDTDGNGKPELQFTGMRGVDGLSKWTTTIFEAIGDNLLAEVGVLAHYDRYGGVGFNTVGNLDGVGRDEIVMEGQCCVWIHQGLAPGSWPLSLEYRRTANGLFAHDVNGNGKDELFWGGKIYEATPTVTVSKAREANQIRTLAVTPNPSQSVAWVLLPESGPLREGTIPVRLIAYDVSGRAVQRDCVVPSTDGRLRWLPRGLPPGVYWLRLDSSGSWEGTARAVVLPEAR